MLELMWSAEKVYINAVEASGADLSRLSYDFRHGKVWIRRIVRIGNTVRLETAY